MGMLLDNCPIPIAIYVATVLFSASDVHISRSAVKPRKPRRTRRKEIDRCAYQDQRSPDRGPPGTSRYLQLHGPNFHRNLSTRAFDPRGKTALVCKSQGKVSATGGRSRKRDSRGVLLHLSIQTLRRICGDRGEFHLRTQRFQEKGDSVHVDERDYRSGKRARLSRDHCLHRRQQRAQHQVARATWI